jgi:hypothetical protein
MTITDLKYTLANGFVQNWLLAGPQVAAVPAFGPAAGGQPGELDIVRDFYEADSGVTLAPVDLGPLSADTGAGKPPAWRYYACRDDHFVDLTGFYARPSYLRAWAYAQLWAPAGREHRLQLTTHGPADVWQNGQHRHRQEHFDPRTPRSVSFPVELQPGCNELLIRFENAGVREVHYAMALRLETGPQDLQVVLPTNIEDEWLALRQAAETVAQSATLDRYVYGYLDGDHYHQNEPITVRFPEDLQTEAEITIRLQSPHGDIFQEASTVCAAGTVLPMARTFPLRNGPHRLVLAPLAHLYYQKLLRFERQEVFHVVRTPYTHQASPDLEVRRTEALEDAAQRRSNSVFSEVARMALGRWEKVNASILAGAIEGLYERGNDAALDLLGLLSAALRFDEARGRLGPLWPALEAAILGYRYADDDAASRPNDGGSEPAGESGQLLVQACELLAGQLLPDQPFAGTGQTGAWHQQRAEGRLLAWLRRRGMMGFRGWDSPASVEANLAALGCLADLAAPAAVGELAAALMDKILFSLAINSFRGAYGSSRGDTDTASVLSARLEPTSGICRLMWGLGNFNENLAGTVSLACSRSYELPGVIAQIAHDVPAAFWSEERHVLPGTSGQAAAGSPGLGGQAGEWAWQVNKVTYKTKDFMLCCAQDYYPGQLGRREHIWQATLGADAVVFVNHPTSMNEDDAARPNLWAGNGVLPRAAQWGDVVIAVHKLPADDWLGFTHAYFPAAAFAAYSVDEAWAFARAGEGYLALRAMRGQEFITRGQTAFRELRSRGAENVWLCHMGQALLDGSFEDFKRKVLRLDVAGEGLSIRLTSLRGDKLQFGWQGPLLVNGQPQPLSGYRHFNNHYCRADVPAARMEIVAHDEGIRLEFE